MTQRSKILRSFLGKFSKNLEFVYSFLSPGEDEYQPKGTAFIEVEDDINPFLSGVRLTIIPSGVSLNTNLKNLSGGQKALGGFAYYMAIAITTKAKLVVLDEVDASMDSITKTHMLKFIDFIKKGK